ncbi:uncharacterized protein KY384_006781 [Bacidia gigantensis]|uniref:uncharacterized protein n=1 Tax=Bacidia gigantensis TaxID=2732470 RepID=UPI001D04B544|nr:uncharacterized protein KY384_006781 [Bacidia gigantensis]KAG8527865.1 hypothetical protein KY384_006781 [Bacidia gigantensis]
MALKAALDPVKIKEGIWGDILTSQEAGLPELADIDDESRRVIRIMGGNPGAMQLQGTNTFLVGTGKSRILIDTGQGIPLWADNVTKVLQEQDLDLSHILITHWHGDHTGGIPDLIDFNPLFASRIYKNDPDAGQHPIEDGQLFRTEGATMRAIHTPGHSVDHMCFLFEEENALFTGDNVLGHGFSVCEDLGAYMTSLAYMEEQRATVGYPAHGVKIEDLPRVIKQYIRHKKSRERQVFTALMREKSNLVKKGRPGKASLSIRELVFAMHGDVPEEMFESAMEPFMTEVLWKLAEDRKVGFEMFRGNRRWFINERTWKAESRKQGFCD